MKFLRTIFNGLKWACLSVIGLVLLVILLLYLPPVQDIVVGKVVESLNKNGDMEVAVKKLRLTYPLNIAIDSLQMKTPGMTIGASRATTGIAILPLFYGEIKVRDIDLHEADVVIGTPDSILYMRSHISRGSIENAGIRLLSHNIDIDRAKVTGSNVDLTIKPDTTATKEPEDSTKQQWKIHLGNAILENTTYMMVMLPTIERLDCTLQLAELNDGNVNLGNSTIDIKEIALSKADAEYITPTEEYLATHPLPEIKDSDLPTASVPWTVTVDKIRLDDSHGIYATSGATPAKNFDPAYIEASQIAIAIDSFRNRGTEVRVPIREISARERCGIAMTLSGLFEIDSTKMQATGLKLATPASQITLDGSMGIASIETKNTDIPVTIDLDAAMSMDDISRLVPATMTSVIAALPPYGKLLAYADINGSMADMTVKRLSLELPRHLKITASGRIADMTEFNSMNGNLKIDGTLANGNLLKQTFSGAKTAHGINFPPLTLAGNATFDHGKIDGDLKATTGDGKIALQALWNNRQTEYDIDLNAEAFPVQSFMPGLGIRDLDATVKVSGAGIDPFSPETEMEGTVDLRHVTYHGRTYRNINLAASVANGDARIEAASANRSANLTFNAEGNLAGDTLNWTFNSNVKNIDLHALALSDTTATGSINLSGRAALRPQKSHIERIDGRKVTVTTPMALDADVDIAQLYWRMPAMTVNANDLTAKFRTDETQTKLQVLNHDMKFVADLPVPLDSVIAKTLKATSLLESGIARRSFAIDSLQQSLPPFTLNFEAGTDNILANYLLDFDISFKKLMLNASNDTLLKTNAVINSFKTGETRLDSINLAMHQRGKLMTYDFRINNAPGTLDEFAHLFASGYFGADKLALIFKQQNITGDTGFSFGSIITMPDSTTFAFRFVPYHPVIGYKEWEINRDNIITFNVATRHIDANIDLHNSVSSLNILTEHNPAAADSVNEDVIVKLKDIKLTDWLAMNPFAPPVKGNLSADMRFSWNKPNLNGAGTVSLADLTYGRDRVGTFDLDLDIRTNASGTVRATAGLMIDGVKTITASGNLNDSTAIHPFLLDFDMIRFPLAIINPFLPAGTAQLSGVLNGAMDISGELGAPVFNGWLDFDSTAVNVAMLGSSFRFSEEKIPVENNIVAFNGFEIATVNQNPLKINGTVDFSSLSSPKIGLHLTASNSQIVGSSRKRKQDVYGKAFVDLDAQINGTLNLLKIKANAALLAGTNVTYVIPDVASVISSRSNQDMVKFVNFADTAAVIAADSIVPPSMMMNVDAILRIDEGSTIAVDLSADGKNRAQMQSSGQLNYSIDYMGDDRLTGRLNINNGFVRYTPPFMSEKNFAFQEGSFIAFNGEMMNPTLNIQTVDQLKANVKQQGADSRMVNFDIALGVTGTLENMNIAFDLSSPDDLTIENELKAMSPEQRANQAMNLLLYNVYTGPGTRASTVSAGNPLYSFLESKLNTWAASTIKGVDLSFGISQFDKTVEGASTTAMSYSYRVSKSLFDDRFKIAVGGNYTTDADADENLAQNLIADISFEYMLNKSGSMYVKIFRHTGYESILEGEITQTGVGFVYKRKIQRLSDIFRSWKSTSHSTPADQTPSPATPQEKQPQQVSTLPKQSNDETTEK